MADKDLETFSDGTRSGRPARGPLMGVTQADDYQVLRVTSDGWAMLHPDLVATLERIERKVCRPVTAEQVTIAAALEWQAAYDSPVRNVSECHALAGAALAALRRLRASESVASGDEFRVCGEPNGGGGVCCGSLPCDKHPNGRTVWVRRPVPSGDDGGGA